MGPEEENVKSQKQTLAQKEAEEICKALSLKIKTFTDGCAVRMNSHPRAIANMVQLHLAIENILKEYFFQNIKPTVHIPTREELENSITMPSEVKPPSREKVTESGELKHKNFTESVLKSVKKRVVND